MTALTLEEARERSRLLDVRAYRVELDVGNGLARPAGDGRWELAATPPIATYLVTLVAGPYFSISTEHHDVPFGRPHRVWIGVYDKGPGELALRARVPVPVPAEAAAVVLPAAAVRPEPALLLPNDGDFSYCKVRLDPRLAGHPGLLARPPGRSAQPRGGLEQRP